MISKSQQALAYLIGRLPAAPGRTAVIKLCYLADIEARRAMGRPITEFEYIRYDRGPFDQGIYVALEELQDLGLVQAEVKPLTGGRGQFWQYRADAAADIATLDAADRLVLDYVLTTYGALPLPKLVECAYETPPMTHPSAKHGTALRMDVVDGELLTETNGVTFQALVDSERRMSLGDRLTAAELLSELGS